MVSTHGSGVMVDSANLVRVDALEYWGSCIQMWRRSQVWLAWGSAPLVARGHGVGIWRHRLLLQSCRLLLRNN